MQRLEKEFEALKGRGGEARTKAYDKGKAEAINYVLGVADNFERAAGAITAETDGEAAVVAYYKDAYDHMMKCLEGIGLKEVDTVRDGRRLLTTNRGHLCFVSGLSKVETCFLLKLKPWVHDAAPKIQNFHASTPTKFIRFLAEETRKVISSRIHFTVSVYATSPLSVEIIGCRSGSPYGFC